VPPRTVVNITPSPVQVPVAVALAPPPPPALCELPPPPPLAGAPPAIATIGQAGGWPCDALAFSAPAVLAPER